MSRLKITRSKIALTVTGTMLFSRGRLILKINQSKLVLTYKGCNAVFPEKSKTKNHPVKNSVMVTQDTTLFCQDPSGKTENQPVKTSINTTAGTMLLSKGGRLKITLSEIPLKVHRI